MIVMACCVFHNRVIRAQLPVPEVFNCEEESNSDDASGERQEDVGGIATRNAYIPVISSVLLIFFLQHCK